MLFRFLLLLAILGGLGLLVWSNLQPVALVFLGIQTPPLPLAFWIVGAIAAGVLTHILISTLFSLSSYAGERKVRSRVRQSSQYGQFQDRGDRFTPRTANRQSRSDDDDADWKNWDGYEDRGDRQPSSTQAAAPVDDWETPANDDWDDEPVSDSRPERTSSTVDDRRSYEVRQEPKTSSRSGSVYSYSYRDDQDVGDQDTTQRDRGDRSENKRTTGKREMIVDADYRVIVPPYRPPETNSNPPPKQPSEESADDWFE